MKPDKNLVSIREFQDGLLFYYSNNVDNRNCINHQVIGNKALCFSNSYIIDPHTTKRKSRGDFFNSLQIEK